MALIDRIANLEQIVAERADGALQALFVNRIRRGDDGPEPVAPDGYQTAGLPPIYRADSEGEEDFQARCLALAASNSLTGLVVFRPIAGQNSTEVKS